MQYNKNRYNEYMLRKNACGNIFKGGVDLTKSGIALLHGISLAGGITAGYALSRASSPSHIVKNSDLELIRNNLMTELAMLQKQLDDDKKKYEEEKKAAKERRPYDRFLN